MLRGICHGLWAVSGGGRCCAGAAQNALKEKPDPLPFLDAGIEKLERNYAGSNVSLQKGDKFAEQYFVFPNKITEQEINENCFKNPALAGNYWLLLRANSDLWSPVLVDDFGNCVIGKLQGKKVIFSSVLLDYQKHCDLLQNILVNLMVENMSLAILETGTPDTLGFSYFLNSLENNKLYYKRYANDEESTRDLLYNIRLGVHSAILVNDTTMGALSEQLLESINQYGVKLIQIKDSAPNTSDSFLVHSVDKSVALLFSKIELKIQEELASGFVSGSFMKTVEVLMKLKEFEKDGMTKGSYTKESIAHALEQISSHMHEDGSYDKTFGATCKALWLFATFLGKNDKLTRASYQYIKHQNSIESIRERLEKHFALAPFEKDPAAYLREQCAAHIWEVIDGDFAAVTEYDFLTILKVALQIGEEKMLTELFGFIKAHTDARGEFFNSYVTAAVSSYLIDMYDIVGRVRYKEKIRSLLFDMVIYLRHINTQNMSIEEVLQVVCALYKFETVVSFPVNDLTELIFKTGTFPHDYHAFENQINKYQKSRLEIDRIVQENKTVERENRILRIYKKGFFVLLSLLVVSVYFTVYALTSLAGAGNGNLFATVFAKIVASWPSLFTLLIVPVVTFIFDRYLKKREDK